MKGSARKNRESHPLDGEPLDMLRQRKDVNDLGRKARARLEEERHKRAETVCIATEEVRLLTTTKKMAGSKRKSAAVATDRSRSGIDGELSSKQVSSLARRKRRLRQPGLANSTRNTAVPQNADMWMPSIDHLRDDTTMETKSSLVRLHGLPKGTTTSQIKRFFSGLQPQMIGVLLTYDASIPQWDSVHRGSPSTRTTPTKFQKLREQQQRHLCGQVKRYPPQFRVVVKFATSPAAELAADRSGETIDIASPSIEDMSMSSDSIVRAAIGVTQLSKLHAFYILQNLCIDVTIINDGAGGAIDRTLSLVERDLLPNVGRILWMGARQELNLTFDPLCTWPSSSQHGEDDAIEREDDDLHPYKGSKRDNSVTKGISDDDNFQSCIRHRNLLFDAHQKLKKAFPFPSAELLDPILGENASVRLTNRASTILGKRISRLDDRLLEIRRRRFFVS